ncbi:MAG: SGNH/GDSL hydrolase family protein [Lachnospiraceae bacterium]|nr:SGNH/GDSL hydrolase family protein [Lachnospiraceae bacterium]
MKKHRLSALFLVALFLFSMLGEAAYAAPKTMPNGVVFDAAFYAATYPDVVAALGKSESALFKHYMTFGIKEGRRPTADAAAGQPAVQKPSATAAPVVAPKAFQKRWKGRNVSILGDSISTFGGTIPENYVPFYPKDEMPTSDLTWWMQTIRAGGMKYVRNASWSGSRVTGNANEESGNPGCSVKRAKDLFGKDTAPNLIFVMMGANDFLADVAPDSFAAGYRTMLNNLRSIHPGAQVVCLTITPIICTSTGTRMQNDSGLTTDDYNSRIRTVAAEFGIPVCDTAACGISTDNWSAYLIDGLHPNAQGMALIASYIVNHL